MKVLKLILKNSMRHKLRTSLTIFGIAIAVMAFVILRTVVTAWYAGVEASSANRLITRQAISFIFPLPYSYREKISQLPGVTGVTFANWFQGVYVDKNQFFARFAIESDAYFDIYPEYVIPADQLEAYKKERSACIIGKDIAVRYNLKIGDLMTIDGDIFPGKWDFVVRAIYEPRDKTVDPTQMLFHWEYLDERMKQDSPGRAGQVGWYVVKIKDASQSAAVSQQVDALFKNSRDETKTETERAFQEGFIAGSSVIISAMNFMSFVIIGIIMLVLGNTMIMSARERTREYAVLKTLGFSGKHLVGLILGESLVIAFLGAGVGVFLSIPAVDGFAAAMPKGFFPIFFTEPLTYVIAASSAILIGLMASIFPLQRALSIRIVDGLRFIG